MSINRAESALPMVGGHVTVANARLTNRPTQTYLTTNRRHVTETMFEAAKKRYAPFAEGKRVIAHAPYVTHPWSAHEDVAEKSFEDIAWLTKLCNYMNVPYLLIHLPARLDAYTNAKEFERVSKAIKSAVTPPCKLLFENVPLVAIPYTSLDTANAIFANVFGDEYGLCIDTAHLFVSGVKLTAKADVAAFIEHAKWPIKWIHLNGNKTSFNSKRDKHTFPMAYDDFIWGEDHSGLCALLKWAHNIPAVIESPGSESIEQYNRAIDAIGQAC